MSEEKVLTGANARTKEIAIVAVLIAIGAVLRMVSPAIAGITPNFVIAMYCLSIMLVKPKLPGAVGIGFAAGAISMVTTKSPIPYINLLSEPVGAVVALMVLLALPNLSVRGHSLRPLIIGALATIASGSLYVISNMFLLNLPVEVAKVAFLTVVVPVTLINGVITQILYYPTNRFVNL
ncbi:MAG: hypothetical protein GX318_02085 [Clostridia bacterium]|nr:hypothetical protein [Clostridia bacterium]